MKAYVCSVFLITFLCTAKAIQNQSCYVDSLLDSLRSEEWTDDEGDCKDATIDLLKGVMERRTWATYIWDSLQLPVAVLYGSRNHLGSFEQCLEDPWSQQSTQYCLVDVQLTKEIRPFEEVDPWGDIEDFVRVESKHGHRRLNSFSLGVCLPRACSPSSVAKISQHIHMRSHLPFGNVTVDPGNCQVKGMKEYSMGFYVFWILIFLTSSIVALVYVMEDSITNPKLSKMASWFSPSRNFSALTKLGQDEMMSLNGLRTFSAEAAVIMHYFYYIGELGTINTLDIAKDMDTVPGWLAVQLALLTDTFFIMSGVLHMISLITNRSSVVKILSKRYLRLLIPYAICLLFMSEVLPHTVSGPLRPWLMKEQAGPCSENWWLGLLMINNFVRTEKICHIVTWYLSADYQLTILGTVIFILCRKWKQKAVFRFSLAIFLVFMILPAIIGYWNRLPAILIYDIESAAASSNNVVFLSTYIKPYNRANAYLIGMALGYIMHHYKPKDCKKISKKWSIVGGIFALVLMIFILTLGGYINSKGNNALHVAAYMALDRTIFATCVCLLVVVCEYGTFPIIGSFLTSRVFTSLSRLTYGIYLYHMFLIYSILYSSRTPPTYNFFHLLINGFGLICVCFMISYLHWFFIEAPAMNFVNSLFKKRTNATSEADAVHQKSS